MIDLTEFTKRAGARLCNGVNLVTEARDKELNKIYDHLRTTFAVKDETRLYDVLNIMYKENNELFNAIVEYISTSKKVQKNIKAAYTKRHSGPSNYVHTSTCGYDDDEDDGYYGCARPTRPSRSSRSYSYDCGGRTESHYYC